MAHHITPSRATAMMVNTAQRGLVRVARPGIDEVSPAAGLGKAGGPRINPKSPGSREPCGSLMKGILTTAGTAMAMLPLIRTLDLAVRESSPTACTNNQSAGDRGLPRNDQAALQAHSFSRPCCTAGV